MSEKNRGGFRAGSALLILVMIVASVFCFRWLILSVHSDAVVTQGSSTRGGGVVSGQE